MLNKNIGILKINFYYLSFLQLLRFTLTLLINCRITLELKIWAGQRVGHFNRVTL